MNVIPITLYRNIIYIFLWPAETHYHDSNYTEANAIMGDSFTTYDRDNIVMHDSNNKEVMSIIGEWPSIIYFSDRRGIYTILYNIKVLCPRRKYKSFWLRWILAGNLAYGT